ncbi:hypothetical protein OZN62_11015 [Aurantiacibacter sp. MUD11]|uniref:hypothetical protein n=1 Tax=Aurantiacibacter sp. MUD11 TaxID=3003265 RepID=UPI0022AA6CB2|nr:hypothetical protein [Aurantiacibacter sp. MUD11]WAT17447.1 hypothetical protein OZN62_11015 [Aurantiacibacter sp. MUD11]
MNRIVLALALAATAVSAPPPVLAQQADLPQVSLDHRMLLRCSAAFALVAFAQASGNETGTRYPDVTESGREFFVRASAQVMDEAGLDRTQIEALLNAEAQALWDEGSIDQVMPVCLPMLPPE